MKKSYHEMIAKYHKHSILVDICTKNLTIQPNKVW